MKCGVYIGLFYVLINSISIITIGAISKHISYINPCQLALFRNIGVLSGVLPIVIYCTKEILGRKGHRHLLFIRGFAAATTSYLSLVSYTYLPLAVAATIISSAPVVVTLVARIFLKEKIGVVQCFAILVTFIGVLLTFRIPELAKVNGSAELKSTYIIGLLCAFGSVTTRSISFVTMRKLKDLHFSSSLLYVSSIGIIGTSALTPVLSSYTLPLCGWDNFLIILISILGFTYQMFLTLALQRENAGVVSVMKVSFDIILAILFQIVIFHNHPDGYTIGGCVLVTASVAVTGMKKWLLTLPDESTPKRKLKYLLL